MINSVATFNCNNSSLIFILLVFFAFSKMAMILEMSSTSGDFDSSTK